ncbi:MAG: hypothetical protein ACR2HQ_05400 [Ilumatobacteraceae bacterium]
MRAVAEPQIEETFPFAHDRRLRRWSRCFLVHPETAYVRVSAARLTVMFGRWSLSTATANVASVEITGPYRWWKVAGPPRLSLADRGITFATTAERGVCITFRRPVTAIDPFGLIHHPEATITVDDPDAFVAALRRAMSEPVKPSTPATAHPQATPLGTARALWRWNRRRSTLTFVRRDVQHVQPPLRDTGDVDDPAVRRAPVQRFADGVGPAFHRTYRIVAEGSTLSAAEAMTRMQTDLQWMGDDTVAPFNRVAGRTGRMRVGDRYVVALAGPWSGPVVVVEVTEAHFRLMTLEGHPEAGVIDMVAADVDGGAQLTIESWARSGDHVLRVLYDNVRLAEQLQSVVWVEMCDEFVRLAGGRPQAPVEVITERAQT